LFLPNSLKDLSVRFVIASKLLDLAQDLLGLHWPPCINVALQPPNHVAKAISLHFIHDDASQTGKSRC
jgi:hypothetical protein